MKTKEKPIASRCKKLHELPQVVNEWQQKTWRPDCDYYDCGTCGNPMHWESDAPCPFDGKVMPLLEVADEAPNDPPKSPARSDALEQAVKDRIVDRTGRRMQALAVELTDGELVVRGAAPCYYVKQLAIQGVLDALHGDRDVKVKFNCQIVVFRRGPRESIPWPSEVHSTLNPKRMEV